LISKSESLSDGFHCAQQKIVQPWSRESVKTLKYSNMSRFRASKAIELLAIVPAFVLWFSILVSGTIEQDRARRAASVTGDRQIPPGKAVNSRAESSSSPHCENAGKKEITITCHYAASPAASPTRDKAPRVVLNDAVLSFKTGNESYMHVEFTFTNESTNLIFDGRSVYIAIDDNSGRNYVRRLLPRIDFRNLVPSVRQKFSERFLVPALQPGDYTIHLWIPSAVPNLKFDPSHNFLLSNVGVPDQETGLNTVATFTVVH
jgi:hypothetical protein